MLDEEQLLRFPLLAVIGGLGIGISTWLSYWHDRKCIAKLEAAYRNRDKDSYADIF